MESRENCYNVISLLFHGALNSQSFTWENTSQLKIAIKIDPMCNPCIVTLRVKDINLSRSEFVSFTATTCKQQPITVP